MLRLYFDRPTQQIQCFDAGGKLVKVFTGEGDAWGHSDEAPYGHDGWTPPGHYMLGAVDTFGTPEAAEGFGQIPVLDLTEAAIQQLVAAGKAQHEEDGRLTIVGVTAWTGQMAAFDRGAIMIHCGGSNAPDPYADRQQLCKTEGCTRMYNIEWRELALWINAQRNGNTVIFTVVGDPVPLEC